MDRLQEMTLPLVAVVAVTMAVMAGWGLLQSRSLIQHVQFERVVVTAKQLISPTVPVPTMKRRTIG
ncbi:hypothetical protein BH10PSE17_BH10PSE17_16670 [soil metagenome]